MICHYHLRELVPQPETRIPFDAELSDRKRTTLRCPVSGCPVVGQEYDEKKIDERTCTKCGARISGHPILTDNRCNKCKNGYARRSTARKKLWLRMARVRSAKRRQGRT